MNTIEELILKSNELLDENRNSDAAELVELGFSRFPLESQSLLYCLLCIHSINQDKASVLGTFRRARENQVWWSPDMIRKDDDFAWLVGDTDFLNELSSLETTFELAQSNSKAITKDCIYSVNGPWVVNLHKRNNSIERTLRYFDKSNSSLGLNTRYVQSSQPTSSNGFSWDDKRTALADLKKSMTGLLPSRYTLCGTSQGGDIAFVASLELGTDYLGIMPAITVESLSQIEEKPKGRYLFLVGDKDPYRAKVLSAKEKLVSLGANVEYLSTGDVGHWLPDNFEILYEMAISKVT